MSTLESRLVVSAEDKATKTLAQIERATRGVNKAYDQYAKAGRASAEVARLNAELERHERAVRDAQRYQNARNTFASADAGFRLARTQAEAVGRHLNAVKQQAKALEGEAARSLVAGVQAQQRKAEATVRAAEAVMRREKEVLAAAKSAVAAYAVPFSNAVQHQQALLGKVEATTRAIDKQTAAERRFEAAQKAAADRAEQRALRRAQRNEALATMGAAGGVMAAHRGRDIGRQSVESVADFDYAVRRQRFAVGLDERMQAPLQRQARQIGQETKFTNLDVVKAQTATMQSLPFTDPKLKAEVGAALVDQVRNYAQILEADMTKSAEGLRSFLQTTNKDISTKEKAVAEATRGTNLLVKSAKIGGMSDEDVQAMIKYGMPTGTQAGLSDKTLLSLGVVARRSGLRGDEIGVFQRAAASKLIAPTRGGREALIAAGMDLDSYQKMPGQGLSAANLGKLMQSRFGKTLSDEQTSELADLMENGDVVGDREAFTAQVSEVLSRSFGKTKGGKTKAQDASKIAKLANDFYNMSVENTDTERLLRDILTNPKMTPALRNEFFTDKHGGKAGILANKMDQFNEAYGELDKVEKDPTFAARGAKEITGGVGGSIENLKGSYENLILSIGQANEGLIKFASDGIGKGLDAFSNLSTTSQQVLTGVAALGATATGVLGTMRLVKAVLGTGGLTVSAGALTGSATALTGSATALTAAAARLGAGGGVDDVARKMSSSSAVGKAGTSVVATLGVPGAIAAGGTAASIFALDQVKQDPKAFGSEGGMLGALGGDYAIAGAILEAGEAAKPKIEEAGKKLGAAAGKGIADGVEASRPVTTAKGLQAGSEAGRAMTEGLKAAAPGLEGQARTMFERLKGIFGAGIDVPIKFASGGYGGDGGSGGGIVKASYSPGGAGGFGRSSSSGRSSGFGGGSDGSLPSSVLRNSFGGTDVLAKASPSARAPGVAGAPRARGDVAGVAASLGGSIGEGGGAEAAGPRLQNYPPGLAAGIKQSAKDLGINAEDLATLISFETGGTFDPWKRGPTTKWGTHRGLIQWGEPQARQYGVHAGMTPGDQMKEVTRYLYHRGVRPGMDGARVYAAVNAGGVSDSHLRRRDSAAGGTWGTVLDKWNHQMHGHRVKGRRLLGAEPDAPGQLPLFARKGADAGTMSVPGAPPAAGGFDLGGPKPLDIPKLGPLKGAGASSSSNVYNMGGFNIHAAPGQSADELAQVVERRLSARLNSRREGAYHDGVA